MRKLSFARVFRFTGTDVIPSTRHASSPDFIRGSALILVHTSRYELGAPGPKFSGLPEVPEYRYKNWYLHTIILIYKLRKLSMLFPTSSSLTKMNLAYWAAIFSPWCSRFYWFFSLLIDSYVVLWKLTKSLSFLTSLGCTTLGHTSFARFPILRYNFMYPSTAIPTNGNMWYKVCTNAKSINWGYILGRRWISH